MRSPPNGNGAVVSSTMSLPAFPDAEGQRSVTPAEPSLLPDVLRKWARERPREPALTAEGETLSYSWRED